jgi:hypothetical protein
VRYKTYICGPGNDWDEDRGVPNGGTEKIATVLACPREAEHCYGPRGYVDWHDWADRRRKTHRQKQCECGYWLLMEPKKAKVKNG